MNVALKTETSPANRDEFPYSRWQRIRGIKSAASTMTGTMLLLALLYLSCILEFLSILPCILS